MNKDQYQRIYKAVNVLNSIVSVDTDLLKGGLFFPPIVFRGIENRLEFDSQIDTIYKIDEKNFQTYSRKSVIKLIVDLIKNARDSQNEVSYDQVKAAFEPLFSKEIMDFTVASKIFGVTYIQEDPLTIAGYTIYNWEKHEKLFKALLPEFAKEQSEYLRGIEHNYLISAKIKAREASRAIELAKDKFERFENILRYIINSRDRTYSIGINDYEDYEVMSTIAFSSRKITNIANSNGVKLSIKLDDPYYRSQIHGYDKIWQLIENQNMTDLENRILNAIEWVGKAVHDRAPSKSFVQYIIAIESLFHVDTKEMISPSIVHTISESIAFICADNYDDRVKYVKRFKGLYDRRSKIVHGVGYEINTKDLDLASDMVRDIIRQLLTSDKFEGITKVAELQEWIKKQKFSYQPLKNSFPE